jgi:hypothetical protein
LGVGRLDAGQYNISGRVWGNSSLLCKKETKALKHEVRDTSHTGALHGRSKYDSIKKCRPITMSLLLLLTLL